jgi:hypothetical protein
MGLPHKILEAGTDLFVDAFLVDDGTWLFTSLWGNETTIQQFFARIELRDDDMMGLPYFTIRNPENGDETRVSTANHGEMAKKTAKTPASSIVGEMCHCFIFNKLLIEANRAAGQAFVFSLEDEHLNHPDRLNHRVWSAIKELSQIPLLDHWRDDLIGVFYDLNWIREINGLNTLAIKIYIDNEEFKKIVSDRVKQRTLRLAPVEMPLPNQQTNFSGAQIGLF